MIFLHWIAVPLITFLLLALLIWGMKKDPKAARNEMAGEILSDDPPADPPSSVVPPHRRITHLLEERRLMTGFWGNMSPDLLVSFWTTPGEKASCTINYQQTFIPLSGQVSDDLANLENSLFDGAREHGVPERSRFVKSYTFLRLVRLHQDLVVESTFQGERFCHEFYRLDIDGKMVAIVVDDGLFEELAETLRRVPYRSVVDLMETSREAERAASLYKAILSPEGLNGETEAWLAHLLGLAGAEDRLIQRHLALASEFAPRNALVRLESARLAGRSEELRWLWSARQYLCEQGECEEQGRFFLAQSLLALNHRKLAKTFCEQLLADYPQHSGAACLLTLIKQKERGAQT